MGAVIRKCWVRWLAPSERKAQIAYYVGLKAESEGRISDAADWYRVVLETGDVRKYEYMYSYLQLEAWTNSRYTIAHIQERRRPPVSNTSVARP